MSFGRFPLVGPSEVVRTRCKRSSLEEMACLTESGDGVRVFGREAIARRYSPLYMARSSGGDRNRPQNDQASRRETPPSRWLAVLFHGTRYTIVIPLQELVPTGLTRYLPCTEEIAGPVPGQPRRY
jgi:hypothetical protein